MEVVNDDPSDLERCYFAALDEIWRLREALAYEASATKAHLDYRTFPKSRREVAERQIERMLAAARGDCAVAYAGTSSLSLRSSMREAGANETLTRSQWEASLPQRPKVQR